MKEKKFLKRTKKIGVNLDRLKPNALFPGPSEEDEMEVEEQVEKTPEVDVEAVRKAAEEKARKATEEEARKAAEEEARKVAEEKVRKVAEEEARKVAEEEARKAAEEEARKVAEEKAKMEALQRQQISAVEVKEIVSDETAKTLIEEEEETEKIYGNKKAIINLDTISAHFEANAVITVNVLKEKKLLDKNVYFVKVLARGVLDKPLTIKAQDFSIDAAKMIEITGGRVVMLTKKKYFS